MRWRDRVEVREGLAFRPGGEERGGGGVGGAAPPSPSPPPSEPSALRTLKQHSTLVETHDGHTYAFNP